jgi:hypothetical protein
MDDSISIKSAKTHVIALQERDLQVILARVTNMSRLCFVLSLVHDAISKAESHGKPFIIRVCE